MDNLINISYLYYNKSLDFIKKNNISLAKENLDKAIKVYSKDIDILNLLGLCEYYLCNFNEANFYWKKSLEINKINNLAQKYIEEKLKTNKFSEIMEKYNIALDCFDNDRYEESINIFKNILKYEDKFIEVYEILVILYLKIDDIKNSKIMLEALEEIDKGNKKILFYKEEINKTENKIINKKVSNDIKNEMNTLLIKENNYKQNKKITIISVILVLFIGLNLFNYLYYNKKESKKINNITQELEKEKILQNELKKENEKLNKDIKFIFNNSHNEVLKLQKESEQYYFDKEYKKAIEKFNYILDYSDDEVIIADAIYFIAASNLKLGKKEEAIKYYEIYINKYKNFDAYDEILYNYALILNDENNIEKAKELAKELRKNHPYSQFNNSKIAYIIDK
ncbi:tetratricopeptide repeat protein [Peptacetobacter sp.]|uniref:tetratricopeptide repeat protein n=1 Tax=Peptacetobacter sp. TaxID=2991975 RepID=UPI00261E56B0|nr:tetratricopeptide repeat protein [Peptacetobacter sp.]